MLRLGRLGVTIVALAAGCDAYDPEKIMQEWNGAMGGAGLGGGDAGLSDGGAAGSGPIDSECTSGAQPPRCTRAHARTACVEGSCLLVECEAPYVDCDGESENGCEATLDSQDNCGLCGARCELPGAQTRCEDGRCVFEQCNGRYGDCDDETGNGCETSLVTLDHCGACGNACDAFDHAAPGCIGGECGIGQCLGLFGDCDGKAENGCEQELREVDNCGQCGSACDPAAAVGTCDTGSCAIAACEGEAVDCNGLVEDGCEADLTRPEQCGACGAACELPHRAEKVLCAPEETPRCQVDHACGKESGCTGGAPANGCEEDFGDCNGRSEDGCETRFGTLSDCSGCNDRCTQANAIMRCEDGGCEFVDCLPGFERCVDDSCMDLARDPEHCGECENECGGTTPNCFGGRCTAENCPAGRADCTTAAGCETLVNTTANCGQCGVSCGELPHAVPACRSGRCAIGDCEAGWGDCDGAVDNGCEVDLRTLDNCGDCKQVCNVPFAEESCATGRCRVEDCDPSRRDCNEDLSDGCETSILSPNNCGACGNDCTALPNVARGGCSEGVCSFTCKPGFGDCDGDRRNGCEADFAGAATCGQCGNDCTALPNVASATCNGTLCEDLVCEKGFGDCDGIASNGCERALNTAEDCAACNRPCAPVHGSGECSTGSCRVVDCDGGYADCNGDDADGCEASLTEPAHCGSCDNDCGPQPLCENGMCGCTADDQCGGPSFACCDNRCVNINSVCSAWPCPIPSTRRPLLHCGACGAFCPDIALLFCCGAVGE